jgi:O-antigen/teichoic acid export membrane protein
MSEAALPSEKTHWREVQLAFWNAVKLCASLLATWAVALAIRFVLPGQLGPERYGTYSFALAFAASALVFTTLGMETYVQKEVALRPAHASEFMGGILAVRAALAAALFGGIAVALHLTGRPADIRWVVYVFAAGQLLLVCNSTFSALLHARGTVDGAAATNVVAKLLWGALTLVALTAHLGLVALAGAFAVAEAVKACALFTLCRKHLCLRLRFDAAVTRRVVTSSLPFFVTTLATTLFTRIADTLLGFLANDREVGWFGLASTLAQIAELLAPLMGAVVLPLFSRIAARSYAELREVMRRTLELVLVFAISGTVVLGLGADVWVAIVGGPEYAPSVLPLRLLAPVFLLTYVGMLCADYLYLHGRSWAVTATCLGGLVLNSVVVATLVRPMLAAFGPGSAGIAAALATVATETFTCVTLAIAVGKHLLDRRLLSTAAKLVAACAAAVVVDRFARSVGPSRLLLDAAAYCAVAISTRAVRLEEIQSFATQLRATRSATEAPA